MAARHDDGWIGSARAVLASRWWLAAVLVLAAGLRLAYLLELRATPWFDQLVVDPEYYDQWAQRIAAGDWLGGPHAFYMDPLYPYLLGIVYRIGGHDLWLARLLNVACSVGACAATAVLGRRVGVPRPAASPRSGWRSTSPTSSTSARSTRRRFRCCWSPASWRSRSRAVAARARRPASCSVSRRSPAPISS